MQLLSDMNSKKQTPLEDKRPDYVTVRIPRELYDEVADVASLFPDEAKVLKATGRLSQAMALRLVIAHGLDAVRAAAKRKRK